MSEGTYYCGTVGPAVGLPTIDELVALMRSLPPPPERVVIVAGDDGMDELRALYGANLERMPIDAPVYQSKYASGVKILPAFDVFSEAMKFPFPAEFMR